MGTISSTANQYTQHEIEAFKRKAEKWDALRSKIDKCYPPEPEDEIEGDDTDYNESADLCTIGEIAASAFGYL